MKKYLLGTAAVVMAICFSAFTFHPKSDGNSSMQTYTWHKYNTAGTAELSPVVSYTGTASGARSQFGCPTEGAVTCGRAYDAEGNPLSVFISKPAP
jgi:hypothetical protein